MSNTPRRDIEPTLIHRTKDRLERYWRPNYLAPNYIDIIAADCGWNPLVVGEKMTVHLGGNEYEIKRVS